MVLPRTAYDAPSRSRIAHMAELSSRCSNMLSNDAAILAPVCIPGNDSISNVQLQNMTSSVQV
ncbi:hypothetical protein F443_11239 [Phytophthora nicotianae P1569]|uniref:Uncharacterized protein n=1 Tax=Phytophthora nicotianae P1569 TaxID=1317065 RepID=V9F0Y8_PHYNI|nr:hypothetical protein F443_11239 [Phytophthora nicotianae P1569]